MAQPINVNDHREALRHLIALSEQRRRGEQQIQQRAAELRETGEARFHRTTAKLQDRRAGLEQSLQQAHDQRVQTVSEEHNRQVEALQTRRHEAGEKVAEEHDRAHKAAKKELNHATWVAESVFDAERQKLSGRLKEVEEQSERYTASLDAIDNQAAKLLRRYRQKQLVDAPATPSAEAHDDAEGGAAPKAAQVLKDNHDSAQQQLRELQRLQLPRWFEGMQPYVLMMLILAGAGASLAWLNHGRATAALGGELVGAVVVLAAVGWGLWLRVKSQVRVAYLPLREASAAAREAAERAVTDLALYCREKQESRRKHRDQQIEAARQKYEPILTRIDQRRAQALERVKDDCDQREGKHHRRRDQQQQELDDRLRARLEQVEQRYERYARQARQRRDRRQRDAEQQARTERRDLDRRWGEGWDRLRETARAAQRLDSSWSEPPSQDGDERGTPNGGQRRSPAIRFGQFRIDPSAFAGEREEPPASEDSQDNGDAANAGHADHADHAAGEDRASARALCLPALIGLPERGSMLWQFDRRGRGPAIQSLQAVMARLLTALPPGQVRFTILDPVGLGQNFAGFMHLADYDEALVGPRIWTNQEHIEQRLADLTDHMENVIQKYLRNEFETIDDYNARAGELAEPHHFLVVTDFPVNFSDEATGRLKSIVTSGPRCGVYTLIAADTRRPLPAGLEMADLEEHSINLVYERAQADPHKRAGEPGEADEAGTSGTALNAAHETGEAKGAGECVTSGKGAQSEGGESGGGRFVLEDGVFERFPLALDPPPDERTLTRMLRRVGEGAQQRKRVEVPFESVAPPVEQTWSGDSSRVLRVPIGRSGATRLQELVLGRDVAQHALIAGKTGSGKSTLLHVLTTNLALWFGPDQVEFYLIDFKKGVEFKTYATHQLPHARAVAIESDREFGLSVLERLDEEITRRGDLFREQGVQDLPSYREAVPGRAMPRTLLIIDEFQEFFSEDDKLAQDAGLLLDRLVRQGRAFGVHVLLGSQTLGGASNLPRSTLGQMAVRIALQCSDADSQLILSDDNAAARLLRRPGEAIYNDAGGLLEGNSPFQVCYLPDKQRDQYLERVRERDAQRAEAEVGEQAGGRREPMIVFEGNAPAKLEQNRLLARWLETGASSPATPARSATASEGAGRTGPRAPRAWLGEAVAIKDPTAAAFGRQSGANLLVVGQQDEAAAVMMLASMLALAAQRPPEACRFYVFEGTPADAEHAALLEGAAALLPHETKVVPWREMEPAMTELADELQRRNDENLTDAPSVFILLHGLQRYRMLRKQEDAFGLSSFGGSSFGSLDDEPQAPPRARPDQQLGELLRDGPPAGMHVLTWCDTPTTLERTFDRQAMREFDHRVLFQMSAGDSSNLIDSTAASQLGPYRALFSNEEQGVFEKFRPYGMPEKSWLESAAAALRARAQSHAGGD